MNRYTGDNLETNGLVHWYETDLSKERADTIVSQIQSLQNFFQSHPHLSVPILDVWYDLERGCLITIMENHSDISLSQFLQQQGQIDQSTPDSTQKKRTILESLTQVLNVLCVALPSISLPCILSDQFIISNDCCIRFLLNPLQMADNGIWEREEFIPYLPPEFSNSTESQEASLIYSIGILLCEIATFQKVCSECTSRDDLLARKTKVILKIQFS